MVSVGLRRRWVVSELPSNLSQVQRFGPVSGPVPEAQKRPVLHWQSTLIGYSTRCWLRYLSSCSSVHVVHRCIYPEAFGVPPPSYTARVPIYPSLLVLNVDIIQPISTLGQQSNIEHS